MPLFVMCFAGSIFFCLQNALTYLLQLAHCESAETIEIIKSSIKFSKIVVPRNIIYY